MKLAIYGAGSLGTILGAYISRAGVPVVGLAAALRNIHSPASVGSMEDFEGVCKLARLFMKEYAKGVI